LCKKLKMHFLCFFLHMYIKVIRSMEINDYSTVYDIHNGLTSGLIGRNLLP